MQEGIGHGSFNRLMAIPGVSSYGIRSVPHIANTNSEIQVKEKLGLSYHNIRGLHQVVDSIPGRAEWKTKILSFDDKPQYKHSIHFRDPLEAIQALLGNPAHAKDIVYKPKKMFSDSSKKNRIYNEMWTGKWWHAVQVSLSIYLVC